MPYFLRLEVNVRVILASNIDTDDRLTKGQIGSIVDSRFQEQQVTTICVLLYDQKSGLSKMAKDAVGRNYREIPIERIKASFNSGLVGGGIFTTY